MATETRADSTDALLACIILAHADPVQVRRLIAALDPLPVFLHCDRATSPAVFAQMVEGLPARCVVLPRLTTGWAKWENVAAEVEGYRQALALTDATHVAVLTGSDYPLASTGEMLQVLDGHLGKSFVVYHDLPHPGWGHSGGFARLRYPHWAFRKHMLRVPIPRRLPRGVVLAGGPQMKVLARRHAQAVVDVVDTRPDLVRFWRRSWIADETFVASVVSTPAFVPGWAQEHVSAHLWAIGWNGTRSKSPPWLGAADLGPLMEHALSRADGIAPLFARKFSTSYDTAVLDVIDRDLRGKELVR